MKKSHIKYMVKKLFLIATKVFAFFFFGLAVWLVFKEVHALGFGKIVVQIKNLPKELLFFALNFIFFDYVALSGYDFLALNYLKVKVKKYLIVKTSMMAFALTNTTGHAYLAGGSVRYYFYSKVGMTQIQVLKMVAFESLTYLIGMSVVLDVCLIVSHFIHFSMFVQYRYWLDLIAIVSTVLLIGYFCLPPWHLGKYLTLPTIKLKILQVFVGVCDAVASSFVFYVLFLGHLHGNYFYVASLFLISQIVGIASQVPGGLGVFEATFLYLYPHTQAEKLPLLAVLISFRILYYFLPLFIAIVMFIGSLLVKFIQKRLLF